MADQDQCILTIHLIIIDSWAHGSSEHPRPHRIRSHPAMTELPKPRAGRWPRRQFRHGMTSIRQRGAAEQRCSERRTAAVSRGQPSTPRHARRSPGSGLGSKGHRRDHRRAGRDGKFPSGRPARRRACHTGHTRGHLDLAPASAGEAKRSDAAGCTTGQLAERWSVRWLAGCSSANLPMATGRRDRPELQPVQDPGADQSTSSRHEEPSKIRLRQY